MNLNKLILECRAQSVITIGLAHFFMKFYVIRESGGVTNPEGNTPAKTLQGWVRKS